MKLICFGPLMSMRKILTTFDAWRISGLPMVLATVYETAGSTYSKAGNRMLIAANGDFQGLLSGGCLEGDLAERANRVLESGEARPVTYDLRDEADDLFGLGIGCNGLIRVLLQPLTQAEGYEPFAAIAEAALGREAAVVATVVASRDRAFAPGAALVWRASGLTAYAAPTLEGNRAVLEACARAASEQRAMYSVDGAGVGILYAPLGLVPRLLVLGAGLDALPVVQMAAELGWRVTVADHRPAYIERREFAGAERMLHVDPSNLRAALDIDEFDAILVMSHHLVTDRAYLGQLVDVPASYLGILGPRARRERLLADMGSKAKRIEQRLRGPVGLDIGGHSPEAIALSIVAELQMTHSAT